MDPRSTGRLAIDGGAPVREHPLPYGRQTIEDDDVAAVATMLREPLLTTGPHVAAFEAALAARCGVGHAVAVNNGTTALHAMYVAAGLREGDEVVVPPSRSQRRPLQRCGAARAPSSPISTPTR